MGTTEAPTRAILAGAPERPAGPVAFDTPGLFEWLESANDHDLDELSFGVIGLSANFVVVRYNAEEGRLSRLIPNRVIGRNFFTSVAPCTNNFMVAHRFAVEPEIDDVINYVFTFSLAPIKVHLRLLKRPHRELMYLLVETRD
jgi:photoactive yellow protein